VNAINENQTPRRHLRCDIRPLKHAQGTHLGREYRMCFDINAQY